MNIEYLSIDNGFNFLEKDENNREINIYTLNNCIFDGINLHYPNALIYSNEKLFLPVNEQTMSLKSKTIYHSQNLQYNVNKNYNKTFDEPVFFFVYNVENYYHFLYDSLPNLISYFHLLEKIPELKLLTNFPPEKTEFYRFVVEMFEILGLSEKIVVVEKEIKYSKVFITDSYTHNEMSNKPPRKEIFDFYQTIVKKALKQSVNLKTYDSIYISRRTWIHQDYSNIGTNYTTRRKLVNEDQLVEWLTSNNIQEVFAEQLTMLEKIIIFNKAKFVIGPIGGGIANVVFCNPSTKLIALVSPTFLDVNTRFTFSLNSVDTTYFLETKHVEETDFKTYMRIKTKEGIIGEIEKIEGNELLISYCESKSNVGWNSEKEYKKLKVNIENAEKMDNGLNSPWSLDLMTLQQIIKFNI